jgi:hypothetical protein
MMIVNNSCWMLGEDWQWLMNDNSIDADDWCILMLMIDNYYTFSLWHFYNNLFFSFVTTTADTLLYILFIISTFWVCFWKLALPIRTLLVPTLTRFHQRSRFCTSTYLNFFPHWWTNNAFMLFCSCLYFVRFATIFLYPARTASQISATVGTIIHNTQKSLDAALHG